MRETQTESQSTGFDLAQLEMCWAFEECISKSKVSISLPFSEFQMTLKTLKRSKRKMATSLKFDIILFILENNSNPSTHFELIYCIYSVTSSYNIPISKS